MVLGLQVALTEIARLVMHDTKRLRKINGYHIFAAGGRQTRAWVAARVDGAGSGLRLTAGILIWSLGIPVPAHAELYKYVNEDGVTVLDSHVPARYVKDGYTILSLDGRVLEFVSRALSDKEIQERDSARAESAALERSARERKVADQNLLRIYGTPEDVIRARDTKLASIEGFISASQGKLQRLETQKRDLQAEFAAVERGGGTIAPERLESMRGVENRIRLFEREIDGKREEMVQLSLMYSADLKRLRELQGTKPKG
jgi:hypothetical protein